MITIELDNVKEFMSHLFIKDTFDRFLCREISIDTFVSFRIAGTLMKDFLNDIESEEYKDIHFVPWHMLKPYCFHIIRGSRTPLSLKAVFAMPSQAVADFILQSGLPVSPGLVSGLYLNLRYENKKLSVITGTSLNTFTLDKSVEEAWDTAVQHFIKTHIS